MLRELHITNFAVIEDATVELGPGFNVFTGQTGAGKSLILGAFEVLLGLRSGADMLRGGADEGRVAGVFEVCDEAIAAAAAEAIDQPLAAGDEVLVTRKLFASGRSSVSINGRPATAAMAKRLGRLLVDIHGQHDHPSLLRPASQLDVLDAFGGCVDLRRGFTRRHAALGEKRRRRAELEASASLRRQRLELYEFQAKEIDDVEPTAGEFPELRARHRVLTHAAKLKADAAQVQAALYEADGSVIERLEVMTQVLRDLCEIDEGLAGVADQVNDATAAAREASFDLARYVDRLDVDAEELAEVDARLNALNRLIQKYADTPSLDDPLRPVLDHRAEIEREIEALRSASADAGGLDREIAAAEAELRELGARLSAARRAAASELVPAVQSQLPELGMAEATLEIAFEPVGDEGSGDVDATTGFAALASGFERVEWLVRTNPGQPVRPLRKIASGGELSRITLAIKHVLAETDRTSVLVFDEIDANIGGRLGSVIGRKLKELSTPRPTPSYPPHRDGKGLAHQVLCITHLPQIAALADRHFRIEKSVTGRGKSRQTQTSVRRMAGKARVDELAEMMAGTGATTTTRRQARELIDAAA